MHREEALDALVAAEDISAKVRRRGRWYAVWATVYAGLAFAHVLAVGFAPGTWTMTAAMLGWGAAVILLSLYSMRRPVAPRRFGLLHGFAIGGWAVFYVSTVVFGSVFFPAEPAWWIPGAVLSAVPPLIAARIALGLSREPV